MVSRPTPQVTVLETVAGEPVKVSVQRSHLRDSQYEIVDSYKGALVVRLGGQPGVWVWLNSVRTAYDKYVFVRVDRRVVPAAVYEPWSPPEPKVKEFRVAIDFDSVLHADIHPWVAPHVIDGAPMSGAIEWLERLAAEGARIILHTCRLTQWHPHAAGYSPGDLDVTKQALVTWLRKHGLSKEAMDRVTLWCYVGKPYAHVYVDDKAVAFAGEFYSVDALRDRVRDNAQARRDLLGA